MKNKFQAEYHQNKSYFYFSLLISALTILPQLYFSPTRTQSIIFGVTFILLSIIPKFSKILYSIFIVFIALSNILIGHIAMHWGYQIPDIRPRIEVAFLSPVYELNEYIRNYIDYRDIALIMFSAFTLFLLYRFLKHYTHSYKIFKIIGVGVFTSGVLAVSLYINPIKQVEPFCIPNEVHMILDDKNKIDQMMSERENYIQSMHFDRGNKKNILYDKVIIVMGESVNKKHMSLYGYHLPTTPFLSELKKSGKLYVFDAIAPTNQTRYSIPIDLTEANVRQYENRFFHSCSMISHFKANGYETYWISNQGRVGKNDSSISSIAYEANTSFFANLNYLNAKPDSVLLDYLNKLKINPGREMYVLHLLGSHSDYINRYETSKALFIHPQNIIQEYDNTIYYSDYILSQIFEKFKDEKLLFIYLSDHGENINLENNGHGFLPPYKDEYMVPLLMYSNVANPRLNEIYKDNRKGIFNLEHFNDLVRYVSGISNQKRLSYSHDVIAVEPKNIYNFDRLDSFE